MLSTNTGSVFASGSNLRLDLVTVIIGIWYNTVTITSSYSIFIFFDYFLIRSISNMYVVKNLKVLQVFYTYTLESMAWTMDRGT